MEFNIAKNQNLVGVQIGKPVIALEYTTSAMTPLDDHSVLMIKIHSIA